MTGQVPPASRPVVFDVSHMVSRLMVRAPSGIDRVDILYARHFAGEVPRLAAATHYALKNPNVMWPRQAQALVRRAEAFRREAADGRSDPKLAGVVRWIDGGERPAAASDELTFEEWRARYRSVWRFRLTFEIGKRVPEGAIYLNVAQYLFEHPIFFRWLDTRPDVRSVFFVHDLLPLDFPEFFREGYGDRFERRFATIARHARALIVSTDAVRSRIEREYLARELPPVPIHVAPLPAPAPPAARLEAVSSHNPYFIVIGTIEPRKNHLLLLNVWRELARGTQPVPRLLIVGTRGWENEQVLDVLERSALVRPHVLEASGLSSAALRDLVAGARALLMPSFDEGFGLPIVEALSVGTPVIASDLPVFREVSGGNASFCHPNDGPAWLAAIRTVLETPARTREPAGLQSVDGYFASVEAFLRTL